MANNESFIDEVTEEVRRDRLFALFRRYGWIGGLLIALIVGGTAWKSWQAAQARASAQAFGDAVTGALQNDDPAARLSALSAIPADASQRAVLDLIAAAEQQAKGDVAGALAALDRVAADPAQPVSYRHLARLKSVLIGGDAMPAADRDAALAELAAPGAPFRLLAQEQQALVKAQAGDTAGAVAALRAILQDAELTAGLRQRAGQMIVALGGTPAP